MVEKNSLSSEGHEYIQQAGTSWYEEDLMTKGEAISFG